MYTNIEKSFVEKSVLRIPYKSVTNIFGTDYSLTKKI